MRKGRAFLIVIVILILLGAGGYFGWQFLHQKKTDPVKVYSFDLIGMTEFWGDTRESSGTVSTDRIQTIFLTDTQTVSEIPVQEGQEIKKGDLLMSFDTTLSQLELERKGLEIQKTELDLKEAQDRLQEITWMRPMYFPPEEPETEPTEPDMGWMMGERYHPYFGWGHDGSSQSSAFVLWVRDDTVISSDLLQKQIGKELKEYLHLRDDEEEEEETEEPEETEETDPAESEPTEETTPEPDTEPTEEATEEMTEETQPDIPEPEAPEEETATEPAGEYQGEFTGEELLVMYNAEILDEPAPEPQPEPEPAPAPDPIPEPEPEPEPAPEPESEPTPEPDNEPEDTPSDDSSSEETTDGEQETPTESQPDEEPEEPENPDTDGTEPPSIPDLTEPEETEPDETKPQETKPNKPNNDKSPISYYAIIKVTRGNMSKGELVVWMGIHVNKDGSFSFFDASWYDDYTVPPVYEEETEPTVYIDYIGSGYTYSEIQEMKEEQTQKIRELELSLKMAEAEYKIMERELSDGNIYAEIDGKVISVLTEDEAKLKQTPIIKVSGGGGFYVTANISELERAGMSIGQEVTVSDWESGMTYDGVVTSIGEFPTGTGGNNGMENPMSSSYPFTVFLDETANLRTDAFVSVQYASASGQNGVYLQKPFLRTVQGRSFVYARGADGLLEERTVTTGKSLWGSYTEIVDGLTADDLVAFPYGKNVRPGVPTEHGDMNDLYGY